MLPLVFSGHLRWPRRKRPRVLYCRPWLEILEPRLVPVVLNPVAQPLVVAEGQPLILQITARPTMDLENPANFVYKLVSSQPGATIDSSTGLFQWTPKNSNGSGGFDFTVQVNDPRLQQRRDIGPPLPDSATETFHVLVLGIPKPPVLQPIGNKSVAPGQVVIVQAHARDNDKPPAPITFSLTAAPEGAHIDPNTGLFQWTTAANQPLGTYTVRVRAASTNNPDLFAETAFQISVMIVHAAGHPRGIVALAPPTTGSSITIPANPNNTLVAILARAGDGALSASKPGNGAVVFVPLNSLVTGPFPVSADGIHGGLLASFSLVPANAEGEEPIDFGSPPEEITLEALQQKPLKLSQTEISSDDSSVLRLYTDFFGPAPTQENATRNEPDPAVGESTESNTQP